MSHIFISYSKRDKDYADQLADSLRQQGFNVWIDQSGIEYGVDWWNAIVEGLKECGVFVVIMSPDSKASKWVQREVFLAEEWRKPIFPLLLNGDNWELFVLTQYARVIGHVMPDSDFIGRLSQYVTPQQKVGENKSDLTPQTRALRPTKSPAPAFDVDMAIADFFGAYRKRNWSQALEILGRIRASREDPSPFDADEFEMKVHAEVEEEKRRREQAQLIAERDRQYKRVLMMVEHADNDLVWNALQKFWETFPDHDPDGIAEKVRPKSRAYLPAPFAWIDIPAGQVTLEDNMGTHNVPPFIIAKYPITNAQFAEFVEAGGYKKGKLWSDVGWQQRKQHGWSEPGYWQDSQWNGAEQPVVGVSWHEALAFCAWLSMVSGEKITLPTEQQWQRAAQGDEGRKYPWGNDWDENCCNNHSKNTTPVTAYESKGDSPYGVVDMSGNIWEWCLTEYRTNIGTAELYITRRHVLRGGSWINGGGNYFRSAYRNKSDPVFRDDFIGFRIARS